MLNIGPLELLVLVVGSALLSARIAGRKGHPAFSWLLVGCVVPVLGPVLALMLERREPSRTTAG